MSGRLCNVFFSSSVSFFCSVYEFHYTDAGGLFEGDLFGDVTAGSSAAGTAAGLPGTSAQPQSLQVNNVIPKTISYMMNITRFV